MKKGVIAGILLVAVGLVLVLLGYNNIAPGWGRVEGAPMIAIIGLTIFIPGAIVLVVSVVKSPKEKSEAPKAAEEEKSEEAESDEKEEAAEEEEAEKSDEEEESEEAEEEEAEEKKE